MDRIKREQEEEQDDKETMDKSSEPILTPLITTGTTSNIFAANTDDDTSTESSDTFETWTLVTDKQKFIQPHIVKDNEENRIEILKNSEPDDDEIDEQQHLQDSLKDVTNDDFSDGISIISESESVGRISPHPYVRDHLHDFNLKFSTTDNMDDEIFYRLRQETPIVLAHDQTEQQLRQRRRSSDTVDSAQTDQALEKAFQTVSLPLDIPPLVKRGLQGVFYVGVGLAILAIIGRIVNPTWQPLAGVKQQSATSAQLEQKFIDMELQNNLMRAEIDLLNKQVKYLNSINDPHQQKAKHKEGKTFKAWSGNGDSLKPVDITKEDLRRPYKCPDGSYVEIANMCIEKRPQQEPSLVDQFGQVVGDLKEQSETFKTFEKVAEELQGFQDNPFEQLNKILGDDKKTQHPPSNGFIKNKPIYQPPEDVKQKHQHKEFQKAKPNAESKHLHKYDKSQEEIKSFGIDNNSANKHKNTKNHKLHSHESLEKFPNNLIDGLEKLKENFFKFSDYSKKSLKKLRDDSKEPFEKLRENSKEIFNKIRDNSKESFEKLRENSKEIFKKIRDNSKESYENLRDNSKEKFKQFRDKSKEQLEKFKDYTIRSKFDDSQESKEKSSKERFNRHNRQYDKNNDDEDSGEWQEKYMKHREELRKQNEHNYQDNKNWYIQRGDSRENKRSGEKQYR